MQSDGNYVRVSVSVIPYLFFVHLFHLEAGNKVKVTCHDQDVARCKAFTTHVVVRNVCEEAIKRLRDENRINDICDCPSFKEVIHEHKTFGKMR